MYSSKAIKDYQGSIANLKEALVVDYGIKQVKNLGRPEDVYQQKEKKPASNGRHNLRAMK